MILVYKFLILEISSDVKQILPTQNSLAFTFPLTSNFSPGLVFPIPTLPFYNNVITLFGAEPVCALVPPLPCNNPKSNLVLELDPLFSYLDKLI